MSGSAKGVLELNNFLCNCSVNFLLKRTILIVDCVDDDDVQLVPRVFAPHTSPSDTSLAICIFEGFNQYIDF